MLKLRVLIVHDQPLFRLGVKQELERASGFVVCAEAASGFQAFQSVARCRPHLVLVDAQLPGLTGFEIAAALRHQQPQRALVLLAESTNARMLAMVDQIGAAGALSYRVQPRYLVAQLRRAVAGQPLIFAFPKTDVVQDQPQPNLTTLTPRELEVFDCMAQGFSNREIASAIFVNEQTVKNHLTSIFRKLEVDDRVQALLLAVKRGWVNFSPDSQRHLS